MKTKHLNKEQTLELIEYYKKRIEFNNKLNAFARRFMKERNLNNYKVFNGYHDAPTQEMIDSLNDILNQQDWMTSNLKASYKGSCAAIFGDVYSPAVNTYVRNDLKDLEKHLEELEHSANNKEEENSEFRVVRDLDSNRMNIYFEDIPNEETRTILKRNGFKWSFYLKCWTRQLTQNAESSLNKVKQEMNIK